MLQNYLKIALRNIFRNKVYSTINILGLAIGISACLVIYLLTSFELSFDNFHPDRERIYRVTSGFSNQDGSRNYNSGVSAPIPAALRQEVAGFEQLAAFHVYWAKVSVPTNKEPKKFPEPVWRKSSPDIIICEPSYFQIFQYKWLQGNAKTALQAPNQVVLTEERAEKYFGKIPLEKVMGKRLYYNDSLVATVSGIVKSLPTNSDIIFQDFISFKSIEGVHWQKSFNFKEWTSTNGSSQLFVKLSEGTPAATINKKLTPFLWKHLDPKDEWNGGRTLALQPLNDIHFNSELQDEFSRPVHLPTLYILMGVAAFLLLIAAINFINLATAQSINRVKEIGVRKVLGSNRGNLIVQFLSETTVITFVSVLLSILMVEPLLWAFTDFIPKGLSFHLFSWQTIGFALGITLLTSLLAGTYPAWVISAYNPIDSLKNQIKNGKSGAAFLRKALITFQFATSQVFILGTIIVAAQSRYMLNKDMGFKKDAIVYFSPDWRAKNEKGLVLVNKLKQMSEIETVCLGDAPARSGYSMTTITYHGKKGEIKTDVHQKSADENFIPLYGLKLVAGRNLVQSDTTKEFVINEAFARALGFQKPEKAVGAMLDYWDKDGHPLKLPVVGVLADYHFQSLHQSIKPLFITGRSKSVNGIHVKIKSNGKTSADFKSVLTKIEKAYNEVYGGEEKKFEPQFFDETIAKFYEAEKRMAQILNTATGIAILISCMGLFGLVAFTTHQRTKEIGIRKVLGATVSQIVGLLSKDFLRLVLLAIIIASPIAYYFMNKWLQDFAYRVNISWWLFALAAIVSVVIALLTVSYQAIRAAVANPVKSLRTE